MHVLRFHLGQCMKFWYLSHHALIQRVLGCMGSGSRGGGGGMESGPHPLENNKAIGCLSNTGQDPLENHNPTKPSFNVRPISVRQ